MADANLTVTTLEATAFDKLRVPEAFEAAPVVAVVLPSRKYVELISSQQQRSFTYVLLEQSTYNMTDPLSFDADSFVEAVLAWSSGKKVDAFMAFDCFPTLLASVVNEALKLPGPSFRSVFCCSNKHYTRRWLAPELAIALPPAAPSQFPCVVKVSDTQFYVGTRICLDAADYPAKCAELQDGLLKSGAAARQAFCFKWASRFGWADKVGWTAPADIVLVHTEPFLECVGEYQAEVVVEADGSIDVADTGDIEHGPGGCITVFKAPGTFTLTSKLRAWMKEKVVEPLVALGYRSAAMDIEFVRLQGEEEAYELIEINSRYSYMGNYLHFGHAAEATIGKQMHNTLCESQHADIKEVRNLLNRTRLALGAPPATLPSRDNPGVCKLCCMLYTERRGPLDAFFDKAALPALVAEGTLDAWVPKKVYLQGEVRDADLLEYNGWAKIGCILLTMEDDLEAINKKLEVIVRRLFFESERGFLPCVVIDEDGPGDTGLRHDVLRRTPSGRITLGLKR